MLKIYAVDLSRTPDRGTIERLLPFVDQEKQTRIRRFYHWEDSLRTLFGDILIRQIILDSMGIDNEDITFSTNDYGKPFLDNDPDFHFNISHSGNWVVGAVDRHPVGIDVEQIAPIDLDISKNYFSPDEHIDLMKQPDRLAYFFTLWTLKESYIKIVGQGLSLPLNSFSIRFQENRQIRIKAENETLHDIFFAQYDLDSKFKLSVCAMHTEFPPDIEFKTPLELAERFLKKTMHR